MKDKKHIDKLFRDRFKNFEVPPSPEVWGSIQASLEKRKKDRKLIPLWWKVGGVAALLALLLTIGNSVFNTKSIEAPIVTNDESIQTIENESEDSPILKDNSLKEDAITLEETPEELTPERSDNSSELKSENNSSSDDVVYKNVEASKKVVAVETKTTGQRENIKEKTNPQANKLIKDKIIGVVTEKDAVAVTSEKVKDSEKSIEAEKKNETLIKKELNIDETSKIGVATSKKDPDKQKTQNPDTEVAKVENEKQSIQDAIKEQNEIKSEVAVVDRNTIDRRWEVAPNFAPVYYNSLNGGSSLDPTFSDNSQNGEVNFSYGVQVSYALSERLSVRTGVSNVDLSYATSGIELGTGPVSTALKSIDYGGRQTVLTALDVGTIEAQNSSNGGFGVITPKATNGAAEIVQSISYYEVPLELKYSLLSRKFGVNVIGGLSTLFLGSNAVSVNADDFESTLGEANNLSSLSFSTNIGLGFDYKISKKFKFNIEPMFKYQLNPYTDSSVNFRPYYLGVYTGLSYKF